MRPKDAFYKMGTAVHRKIFNLSKGRIFATALGMPLIELVSTGRRSGKERPTMLSVPIVEGERLVLVASFGGDERHPAWYLNLQANPQVRITMAGTTLTMHARTATEQEREKLWAKITATFEGYARYQQRTERQIPVVILEPRG
jgi:deazaflavin-dependent oxidoreductase (nitroreductase family)